MRKDMKLVVGGACLLLVGLLAYVLFVPAKKAELADEGATLPESTPTVATPQHPSPTEPITISAPSTQPTVTILTPAATSQPNPAPLAGGSGTDSGVAVAAGGPTDWDRTLNTGSLVGANDRSGTLTLMGTSPSQGGGYTIADRSQQAGPATRPSGGSVALGSGKTHKVAYGETLSSIALEYYGNRSYSRILNANPGINPNRLKVGMVLKIPDAAKGTGEATAASNRIAPSGAITGNSYVVKPGDSLQRIATNLYGSADKWEKIYEANKASIGSDPHRLKAGMTLKLPETPRTAAATR